VDARFAFSTPTHRIALPLRLKNKVALLTGAASGIGRATALLLAQEGAHVLAADLPGAGLAESEELLSVMSAPGMAIPLDVTRESDWAECAAMVNARIGRLDILVACAGISFAAPAAEMSAGDWRKVLGVNLDGVFMAVRTCIPLLRKAGGGSIVIVSSASGIKGAPGASAYAASKSALRGFAKSIAVELGPENIRVNTVFPGAVKTEMWKTMPFFQAIEKAEGEAAAWKSITSGTPLGRVATAEEIAHGILYLASSEASFVTGAELVMDGGYTA